MLIFLFNPSLQSLNLSLVIYTFVQKTWWLRHRLVFFGKRDKWGKSGRTGYTGPTGRTGPCHDPPDPSPTVHLHPCILLASSSLLLEVYSSL